MLGGGIGGARIFGHIQARNANLAGHAGDFHQRVQHRRRRLFLRAVVPVATRFKAHAVNGAIDFWLAQNGGNLLAQRGVQ